MDESCNLEFSFSTFWVVVEIAHYRQFVFLFFSQLLTLRFLAMVGPQIVIVFPHSMLKTCYLPILHRSVYTAKQLFLSH